MGRVFGLRDATSNVAFVVAFLVAGTVLGLVGVRDVFALGGALLLVLTVVSTIRFRPVEVGETPVPRLVALSQS